MSTVHKVQGLNLEYSVIDFELKKQESFGERQILMIIHTLKGI